MNTQSHPSHPFTQSNIHIVSITAASDISRLLKEDIICVVMSLAGAWLAGLTAVPVSAGKPQDNMKKKNKALGVFPRSGELLSPKGLSTACGRDMYVKDRWPALPMERILTRQHMSYHHPRPPKGTAVLISLILGVLVDAHSKNRCPPPSVLSIDRHLPALGPQLAASKTADDVHCSAAYRVWPWAIPKGGPQVPSTNEKQHRNQLS